MSKPANLDEKEWYCKISGDELGPLSTKDLLACIKDGAIVPTTPMKLGLSGEWTEAQSVGNLFVNSQQELTSTVSAASEALSNIDAKRATMLVGKDSGSSTKRNRSELAAGLNLSNLFAIPGLIVEFLAEKLSFLGYLFRIWIIIPVLVIGIGYLVNAYYLAPKNYAQNAYGQYQEIWSEIKELRSMKATDEEWGTFQKDASVIISKTTLSLEKLATAKNQDYLLLLWAGRDNLSKMLTDARLKISPSEEKFELQMGKVRSIRKQSVRRPNNKPVSIYMVLMIFIDIVIVGWIVSALFRRRSY